ncbi:MAG: metal ABC transporter permease [Leptospiraceae bacterium]|nr:metal ABC transporter permease [Leptospiraceae bacterium]MDW8307254.1 metal ABC transporter permease [Leptospiraceae bacterium]
MIADLREFWLYLSTHGQSVLLSLPYFLFLAYLGIFLVLRRSTLFAMVLTQAAQLSFILGVGWHFAGHTDAFEFINKHRYDLSEELQHLDLYVFPLTFLFLLPFLYLASKVSKIRESALMLTFLFFTGILPIANRFVGGSEKTLMSLYFSDLLYTSPNLFWHYLPHIFIITLLLILTYPSHFLAALDPIEAQLLGLKPELANIVFYLLVGLGISISVRVLGTYLTMAALLFAPLSALHFATSMRNLVILTLLITFCFLIAGFSLSFLLPAYPTEAVLIVSFALLSAMAHLVARLKQRIS